MKKLILISLASLLSFAVFSQTDTKPVWKMTNYDLVINDFTADQDLNSKGRLLEVIPTGKTWLLKLQKRFPTLRLGYFNPFLS